MQFDYSATASRPGWLDLPADLRLGIETGIGEPVRQLAMAGGGFTPGFAAVINSAWFVKAAPARIPWMFASYTREAEVAALLPPTVPAPPFIDASTMAAGGEDWQVLQFRAVAGNMPGSPWTMTDLLIIEAALLATDVALNPVPSGISPGTMAAEYPNPALHHNVYDAPLPTFVPEISANSRRELRVLLELSGEALAGQSLQHNDLRPDNILISAGRAYFCDWNYLAYGPRWADWLVILCYARAAGLPVDRLLAESELSKNAAADHLDSWLSTLAAYMLRAGAKPEVLDSPRLRAHQRCSAYMLLDWLIERRGF